MKLDSRACSKLLHLDTYSILMAKHFLEKHCGILVTMPERSVPQSSDSFQYANREAFFKILSTFKKQSHHLHIDCKGAVGRWWCGATAENTLPLLLSRSVSSTFSIILEEVHQYQYSRRHLIALLPALLHIQIFVIVEGVVIKSWNNFWKFIIHRMWRTFWWSCDRRSGRTEEELNCWTRFESVRKATEVLGSVAQKVVKITCN